MLFAKLAEGLEDFVIDLPGRDEKMVRRRSRMAAKLKHLPPELALAVTGILPGGGGGLPVYREPSKNVEAVQALRKATDPNRSKLVGAGYGLPAAAAGALLGHLVSGGNTGATLAGAAAGGGTVGALAHRAEKKRQGQESERLLQSSANYESLREQLVQQRLQAMQEEAMAQQMMGRGRQLQKVSVVAPRYGKLFDLKPFTPKEGPFGTTPGMGTGDSSLGPTTTGRGMIWEDYYNKWGSADKAAATSGNSMGVSGVPKPPSPSAGGMGVPGMGTSAPRTTSPAMAPPKLPTVNAQVKLPGPVTPNSNLSAAMPPAQRMPLFGSKR
ncbi:MAG: hypothetical protein KKC37_17115 [Proteobacteria bacterium]|nr:hypothetical protein [Pseudomonadota bacterium]